MNALLFDWPFVGLVAGSVGLLALVLWPRPASAPSRWRDPAWLVCLMLPVYMLHQFEEHGFNLLGQRYHFINELCATFGTPDLARCPASPAFILAVNVGGGVWIPGLLAILFRRRNIMVGACAMGVPLVNSAAHIVPAIIRGSYNSGLLTAVVLFVPMCWWVLRSLSRAGLLDTRRAAAVVATGALTHALLIGSLVAHARGLLPEAPFLAFNVAYGVLPLVLGTLVQDPQQQPVAPARL
jgi:hypothetical protein